MYKPVLALIILFIVLNPKILRSQQLINYEHEKIHISDDTIKLKHKPIIPGSLFITDSDGKKIKKHFYKIDFYNGVISTNFKNKEFSVLNIHYRFYSIDFKLSDYKQPQWEKSTKAQTSDTEKADDKEKYYGDADLKSSNQQNRKLNTRGNIARGVRVGNQQNSSLTSNLNLQIEGELSSKLKIKASLTDKNIPIQPEGNRQNLQEFDKVFIEVFNKDLKLRAGDIILNQKNDRFMKYNKKARGAVFSGNFNLKDDVNIKSETGAAVSKGNFNRMEFKGQEGNQGPYKLRGANNETYIVVISGSEKIYLDGELLTRGETKDYTIDYNTGEISFTSNRIITKDSRIIAEYEYKTSSYNRFMFSTEQKIQKGNSKWHIRYFNESDSKNQPVDQSIDQEIKNFLSNAGDKRSKTLFPSWDSTGFDNNNIRYKLIDTSVNGTTYDSVFVYSVKPDSAIYSVNFSYTGENKGNYVKDINSANGRVFKWVAPVNGEPSGNYSPLNQINTPEKHQMLSIGGEHKLSNKTGVYYQLNLSDYDINTYSNKDAADNRGLALSTGLNQNLIDNSQNKLSVEMNYDFLHKNLNPFESFREKEFKRNWDTDSEFSLNNEHNGKIKFNYKSGENLVASFKSELIYRPEIYEGIRQSLRGKYDDKNWRFKLSSDLLNTNQNNYKSNFSKNYVIATRKFQKIELFSSIRHEWQEGFNNKDSLSGNSFSFHEIDAGINQGRESENRWQLSYKYRMDKLPVLNNLKNSSEAHKLKLNLQVLKSRSNKLNTSVQYRKLSVIRETSEEIKPQNNLAGQFNYRHNSLNGFINAVLFYKTGSGLELKKEYSYLKVPEGQGAYTWTDYNGNGIEELDEFEVAVYQDQANYIRIYRPGNDYIKTYNNNLSLNFNLKPSKIIERKSGFPGIIRKLSNRFNINVAGKNTSNTWQSRYIPINSIISDTSLVFINNQIRNILSWDRLSTDFTADLIYQKQESRNLLVNGLETSNDDKKSVKLRYTPFRFLSINNIFTQGRKSYDSEFFSTKNYKIDYLKNRLDLRFQPGINMRISLFTEFSHKEEKTGGEFSRSINPGIEYTNNAVANGMLRAKVEYLFAKFSGETGTPLAWQMLESLEPGNNFRWTLSFQKRLSNGLQININYQGRKPEGIKTIHTGGIQLRAYF